MPEQSLADRCRGNFPVLQRCVHGAKPLAYLDNAATSQKPECVLRAMDDFYRQTNANVHRGVHVLSEEATTLFEEARRKVARFIHAPSDRQIVFTRGTTEAINLVAQSWGCANLRPGDVVLTTEMEHHSNIVPWQLAQEQLGFTLRFVPITNDGLLDMDALPRLLNEEVKLFAFTHVSNVLGTINPAAELVQMAHAVGAKTLVDAAQSVPHLPVDVQEVNADFVAFSGHKMCGPTGVGVLYGRRALLEAMPPFLGGGSMIRRVTLTGSTWADIPARFEAGTPAIAEVIGLGAACDYLSTIGMKQVYEHDQELVNYAYQRLSEVEGLRILGPTPTQRSSLLSFTLGNIHPHDIAAILDSEGVAIRAGHHCAQPIHDHYDMIASARASFYLYNRKEEVDALVTGLHKAIDLFA